MAQYDGSIRINTKISTKDAKVQLSALQHTIVKTADEIKTLRARMDALKDVKVPTKEFTDLEAKLKKAVSEYDKLQAKMEERGKPTERYKSLQKDLQKAQSELERLAEQQAEMENMGFSIPKDFIDKQADASDKVEAIKEKMNALDKSGNAFVPKVDPKELEDAKKKVDELKQKIKELKSSGKDFQLGQDTDEYAGLSRQLQNEQKSLAKMKFQSAALGGFEKLGKIKDSFKKLGETAKSAFSKVNKSAKKSGGSISSFGSRIKDLVASALIFNQISKAFNAMISGMKEGFVNLYNENTALKGKVDSLKASMLTLKNVLAGAFAPILEIAIPYIQKLIGWITSAVEAVGQLIAALTGRKTYTKAVKQSAAASEQAAKATKKETDAMNKQLSSLDKLNNLTSNDDDDSDSGGTGGVSGAGQMFEEVPIDSKFIEMANRIKEVLAQLFQPLKTAWENQGQFVMDSWRYALEEIGLLAQSVGKDFLEVWNQPETISVLENILIIAGDIGLVVGNLAARFREAWEENDVGLHILENIRNIFGIIIEHIRNAADATVEWSKNLDFSPMLESINSLLEALQPFADNIGAGLEWFYTNVLLPIAGWTIEEAIPAFLDMLSASIGAANEVIEALKPLGQWLWDEFLQPLGQWAGDTIIAAMETITNLLKKFGDWVSDHQEAVQNFTIIIGSFAAAWGIVTLAVTAWNAVAGIASAVTTALGTAITFLTSPIGIAIAAIGAIIAIGVLLYKNWDEISAKAKEVWEFVKKKFEEFSTWLKGIFQKDWTEAFGAFGSILNGFLDIVGGIWDSIKQIFGGIIDFIAGVFTGDWERAWNGVVEIFKGIFNLIPAIVEGVINMAIGIINGIIGGINAITGVVGIPAIPEIPEVSIPRLATGTVVPPNREFLAVLGDNKREPEVVSPLSTIEKAVENAMRRNGGMGSGEITIKIPVEIDGRVLFELMKKFDLEQYNRTGRPSFQM